MNAAFEFLRWVLSLFVARTKAAGATEERQKINQANTKRLERQDVVAKRPVTDDQLQKSLKDGSF